MKTRPINDSKQQKCPYEGPKSLNRNPLGCTILDFDVFQSLKLFNQQSTPSLISLINFIIFLQWVKCLDHKVKIINHLQVDHLNWIEDSTVKEVIAAAKREVQQALKPGHAPGGSDEDNRGQFINSKPNHAQYNFMYSQAWHTLFLTPKALVEIPLQQLQPGKCFPPLT